MLKVLKLKYQNNTALGKLLHIRLVLRFFSLFLWYLCYGVWKSLWSNWSKEKKSIIDMVCLLVQVASTKRYVPILPMIPVEVGSKNQAAVGNSDTSVLQRTRRSRNIPNKRLWQSFDPVGYKRMYAYYTFLITLSQYYSHFCFKY